MQQTSCFLVVVLLLLCCFFAVAVCCLVSYFSSGTHFQRLEVLSESHFISEGHHSGISWVIFFSFRDPLPKFERMERETKTSPIFDFLRCLRCAQMLMGRVRKKFTRSNIQRITQYIWISNGSVCHLELCSFPSSCSNTNPF